MMGERTVMQEALFYEFSIERHVPSDHLLRSIDRFKREPNRRGGRTAAYADRIACFLLSQLVEHFECVSEGSLGIWRCQGARGHMEGCRG